MGRWVGQNTQIYVIDSFGIFRHERSFLWKQCAMFLAMFLMDARQCENHTREGAAARCHFLYRTT